MKYKSIGLLLLFALGCTPGPDDSTGTVSVLVRDGAGYASDIRVLFYDADHALLRDVLTDASGTASASVPKGGAVTALLRQPAESGEFIWAETKLGVEPGDELTFVAASTVGSYSVSVTFPGTVANANFYSANVGCTTVGVANGNQQVDVTVPAWCVSDDGEIVISAVARNTTTGELLASTMATVAAGQASLGVVLPAWSSNITSVTVDAIQAPAGVDSVTGFALSYLGTHILEPRQYAVEAVVGGSATVSLQLGNVGDWSYRGVNAAHSATGFYGFGEYVHSSSVPSMTFDLSTHLPALSAASIDMANATAPVITWQEDLSASDTMNVSLDWADTTGTLYRGWLVQGPGSTAPDVTLPELPADAVDWIPPTDAIARLSFGAYDPPRSYSEIRAYDLTQRVLREESYRSTSKVLQ